MALAHALRAGLALLLFSVCIGAPARAAGSRITRVEAVIEDSGELIRTTRVEITPPDTKEARSIGDEIIWWALNDRMEFLDCYVRRLDGSVENKKWSWSSGPGRLERGPGFQRLPFRDLAAGETAVFAYRVRRFDPFIKGMASDQVLPAASAMGQEYTYVLDAPAGSSIRYDSNGFTHQEQSAQGRVRHQWRARFLYVPLDELAVADRASLAPSLSFSTYEAFDEIAKAYQARLAAKVLVSPGVRRMADQVTEAVGGPREQASALFTLMRSEVRPNPISPVVSSFTPPDPDRILEVGTSESQGLAVLYASLLRSKNIESEFVLSALAPAAALPPIPTVEAIQRILLYIPALDLYVDPVDPVGRFGELAEHLLDTPVLHVSNSGVRVERLPARPWTRNKAELETQVTVYANGDRDGVTTVSATGDFANRLRAFALAAERDGRKGVLKQLSRREELEGEHDMIVPADPNAESYRLVLSWKGERRPPLEEWPWSPLSAFSPVVAEINTFLPIDTTRMDSRRLPATCTAGDIHQRVVIRLPEGVAPKSLPEPFEMAYRFFSARRMWSFSPPVLTIETDMRLATPSRICPVEFLNGFGSAIHGVDKRVATPIEFIRN